MNTYFNKTMPLAIFLILCISAMPHNLRAANLFEEGKDYQITGAPNNSGPVVEEFFNYACPGCYSIEGFIDEVKSEFPQLKVKQVPIELRPSWRIYVKAYYIGEKLGVLDKSHAKLFHRIHVMKKHFKNDSDMKEFFVSLGVTENAYDEVANSYWLKIQLEQAKQYAMKHKIAGSPILLVNQRYKLNNQSLGTYERIKGAIKTLSKVGES